MNKLDLKEGQTYICTDTKYRWWTVGKEYKVVLTEYGIPIIVSEDGETWFVPHFSDSCTRFKLKETSSEKSGKDWSSFKNYGKLRFSMDEVPDEKEKSLDLNKLTIYQLQGLL